MSASSSIASSTLTRSKAAILVITSLAAAYLIYYNQIRFYADIEQEAPTVTGPGGLHRSNAVHRRRRRTITTDGQSDEEGRGAVDAPADNEELRDTVVRPLGDGETVIDDQDWEWSGEPPPSQRNGQNIVQLLFRVSEDATRRNAYVHRGCQCNSCGTVPIRGIRYRCSNCADFDLCEACEAQGLHIKTHIFYKVRIPTSSFVSRQMQPVWYPGDPDTCMKTLPRELMRRLSKETGFDPPELDAYWEQWTFMANTEWREDPDDLCLAMDRKTFDQCLVPSGGNRHAAPNLIHDRMFAFYDTNNDDLISFSEFLNGLAYRKKKDKLKRVFEGFDINGDGYVDRKDFLRMFRSYYVLFKQMHRDMLDGLDDQVMNSSEAHQLITSRQPLSSAFGRDGRFPIASDPRTGEGKAPVDGDLEIIDGGGIISDSNNDLGNREDVIIDAVVREYPQQHQSSWAPTAGNTYWRAVSNPPETIASLQHDVLENLLRERRRMLHDETQSHFQGNISNFQRNPENNETEDDVIYRDWPPSFVTSMDVEMVCGDGWTLSTVPPSRRDEIISFALQRLKEVSVSHQTLAVNEEIHERWKRRQFYTDEEEGAVAPPDWKDEEDILHPNGKAVETSKEINPPSRPISPRSRSSSKVRFAEDTDDFETRSNPSTSSRSIPERWGGMEIPDAEKDAGKEILYQVTQQACNELLDQLFKKHEDLAVAALSSKKTRDKFRHFFTNPIFENWAVGIDKYLRRSKKRRTNPHAERPKETQERVVIPDIELEEIRHRPLEELLAATGFTVSQEPEQLWNDVGLESANRQPPQSMTPGVEGQQELLFQTTQTSMEEVQDTSNPSPAATNNVLTSNVPVGSPQDEGSVLDLLQTDEHQTPEPYHDPTLPQFRPNSLPTSQEIRILSQPGIFPNSILSQPAFVSPATTGESISNQAGVPQNSSNLVEDSINAVSTTHGTPHDPTASAPSQPHHSKPVRPIEPWEEPRGPLPKFDTSSSSHFTLTRLQALESMTSTTRTQFEPLDWKVLYNLREMEALEKQAKARGGWGRLSWEEFEAVVKEEDASPSGELVKKAMMEYLGSWIEFCIP